MTENRPQSAYCSFRDWHPYLPDELKEMTEQEWLARSRAKTWMPFARLLSQRSTPLYKRSDVLVWWRKKFAVTHPHLIQQLIDAGFPDAPTTKKSRSNA
jgi:hypothetical protein